uniref:type IV toxin-antitoxin system AbiEi family antitoxin domain-containing protein n=1 Tax=Agathobacter sp. TaxID=2021311 RepID=UPI004056DED3
MSKAVDKFPSCVGGAADADTVQPYPYWGEHGEKELFGKVLHAVNLFHSCDTQEAFETLQERLAVELGDGPMLKKYSDAGKLERIRKGLYVLAGDIADEYALLQVRSRFAVFSYGTALFLWGLSDRVPHVYDITLPRGANINSLKKDISNLRCHYVQQEIYELGITEVQSPQGAMVKVYDRERCICDLIRDKDQVDMQLYSQALLGLDLK